MIRPVDPRFKYGSVKPGPAKVAKPGAPKPVDAGFKVPTIGVKPVDKRPLPKPVAGGMKPAMPSMAKPMVSREQKLAAIAAKRKAATPKKGM